jgi:serine protease inhibitor
MKAKLGSLSLLLVTLTFIQAFAYAEEALVEGNTKFALNVYEKLSSTDGNLIFSPYSISTAIVMTYAGALNKTESEIVNTLNFPFEKEKLPSGFFHT